MDAELREVLAGLKEILEDNMATLIEHIKLLPEHSSKRLDLIKKLAGLEQRLRPMEADAAAREPSDG